MKPVEWYHARDNRQYGPVSTADLKQLAQTGDLRPDDLVWREGMKRWIVAREVKGLFDDNGLSPSGPVQVAPSPGVAPVRRIDGGRPLPESPAVAGPAAGGPPAAGRPSAQELPDEDRPRLDLLLDLARRQFPSSFVHSAARLFALGGHYALDAAMLVVVSFFVAVGVQAESLPRILVGLGAAILLAILQDSAVRFHKAIDALRRAGESRLGSMALPDGVALLSIALGAAALVWFTLLAVEMANYWAVLGGLAVFIVCEYAAFVAINPAWLRITIAPVDRPSEEAVGLLAFLLKLALGCVPVVFGVGVVYGLLRLLEAGYLLFAGPTLVAEAQALAATLVILGFAALPCAGYIAFVLGWLLVDALRGLVSFSEMAGVTGGQHRSDERTTPIESPHR